MIIIHPEREVATSQTGLTQQPYREECHGCSKFYHKPHLYPEFRLRETQSPVLIHLSKQHKPDDKQGDAS
jgi:hypothetical protein